MIKCKHWSESGIEGFGTCAIGYRKQPTYAYCQTGCIMYQEPGLPEGQHTVDPDSSMLDDFIGAHAQLLIEGRVSGEIADYRLTVCTGRDKENKAVSLECNHYSGDLKVRGDGRCGACGCKTWKISEMRAKVFYPMGCPVQRFSRMPGRRIANDDNSGSRPQSEV